MDIYTARLASFAVKSKRGTKSAKWPHPASFIANPSSLAEAGFYFDPSPEDPDNVTCYLCGKQLSEWGEEDDPFEIHYRKCQDKCAWAVVRCGIADEFDSDGFKFADKSRVPTSKAMEKARLETFKVRWQHDKVRGHGANSKIMAKAGFVHTPQDEDDDLAICLYCHVSLSGWDADDDPLEEHRKRVEKNNLNCPFFPNAPSKPASRATKSKKQHDDQIMLAKIHDGPLDSETSDAPTKTPKRPRTVKKGAKTPKARATVLDTDDDTVQMPIASKSSARETDDEIEKKAPRSRAKSRVVEEPPKKSRSKSKVVQETDDDEEVAPVRQSRAKSKASADEAPKKARGKSKAVLETEDEEEAEVIIPPKRTRTMSKATAPIRSRTRSTMLVTDTTDAEDVVTKPKRAAKAKPASVAKRQVEEEVEVDDEMDAYLPPPTVVAKKPLKPFSSDEEDDLPPPPTVKKAAAKSRSKAPVKDSTDIDGPSKSQSAIHDSTDTDANPPSRSRKASTVPKPLPTGRKASSTSKPVLIDSTEPDINPLPKGRKASATTKPDIPDSTDSDANPLPKTSKPVLAESTDPESNPIPKGRKPSAASKPALPDSAGAPPKGRKASATSKPVIADSTDPELPPKGKRSSVASKSTSQASSSKKTQGRDVFYDGPVFEPAPVVEPKAAAAPGKKKPVKPISRRDDDSDERNQVVKLVEISTDEEDEEEVPKPIKGKAKKAMAVKPQALEEEDVEMIGVEEEKTPEIPRTPPRRAPSPALPTLPPRQQSDPDAAVFSDSRTFFSPSSRTAYSDLEFLTESELDMTVEQWFINQIELEYQRVKEDGEAEIRKFEARAAEVRVSIQAL